MKYVNNFSELSGSGVVVNDKAVFNVRIIRYAEYQDAERGVITHYEVAQNPETGEELSNLTPKEARDWLAKLEAGLTEPYGSEEITGNQISSAHYVIRPDGGRIAWDRK